MKPSLLLLALLLASVLSCGQRQDSLLMKAYQTKSNASLSKFFNQWAHETPSLSAAEWEKLNDTLDRDILLQKVYVETASYLHVTMDSVIKASKEPGNQSWTTILGWPKPKKYDSVIDFRPRVLFAYPQTVVLTGGYRDLLNRFLGNQQLPFAARNIMAPARSRGESVKRKQFLEQDIKLWYGHWGGYWQLLSYPAIGSITFDRTFQHALINYELVYEGGYAYFT